MNEYTAINQPYSNVIHLAYNPAQKELSLLRIVDISGDTPTEHYVLVTEGDKK